MTAALQYRLTAVAAARPHKASYERFRTTAAGSTAFRFGETVFSYQEQQERQQADLQPNHRQTDAEQQQQPGLLIGEQSVAFCASPNCGSHSNSTGTMATMLALSRLQQTAQHAGSTQHVA